MTTSRILIIAEPHTTLARETDFPRARSRSWCVVWLGLSPTRSAERGRRRRARRQPHRRARRRGRRGVSRADSRRVFGREGYAYRVVNAGVSGDTTAGALRRVDWVLRSSPTVVIVALGANDGLRGSEPDGHAGQPRRDRRADSGAARRRVLLAGMRLPPNYGAEYTRAFERAYSRPSREARRSRLMPFLLDGVAGVPRLNQPDGIHPTAAGQQVIADHVWPYLRPLLKPVK